MRSGDLSKRKAIILIIVIIAFIVIFGLTMYMIERHGMLDEGRGDTGEWGNEDDEIFLVFNGRDYISYDNVDVYMLAGTDTGAENWGEAYSGDMADFVAVLVADNNNKKYAIYQIDRNTMVDVMIPDENGNIETVSNEQLCTAHWYGMNDEERNDNLVSAAAQAMGELTADHYFILSMEDIGKVNDVLGGVEVTIDEDMTDIDPAFTKGANVKLSGDQAEKYLRARKTVGEGTNAERMARQKQYLSNAYTMIESRLKENPEYINELYEQLGSLMQSDGETNISKLTNQLITYDNQGILQFDGESRINDTYGDGVMHEEFYQDQGSVLEEMRKVMRIEEDNSSDDEEE